MLKRIPIFCIVIFVIFCVSEGTPGCVGSHGTYNLSVLNGIWPVPVREDPGHHYVISLCNPISFRSSSEDQQCVNSSVCKLFHNQTISLGSYSENATDYVVLNNPTGLGFSLFLTSSGDCNGKKEVARTVITFMCGPNLGSPELTSFGDCQANFFWRTSAACKTPPQRKEVPCYFVDQLGNKIDLSYLIKQNGAYAVETSDASLDLFINVCSDIVPGGNVTNCPANSSACVISGNQANSVGSPVKGLRATENGAILTYETSDTGNCHLVTTYILFKCMGRLQSHQPRLLSHKPCSYFVEWETEYACPDKLLNGDLKQCRFTKENNDVAIDLSPLRKDKEYYTVNGTVHNNTVQFILNVCGGLEGVSCNGTQWKSVSACMYDKKNNKSFQVGTKVHSELKFVDGQVFLTYGRGRECAGREIQESTVINFACSEDGNDTGPMHVSSENCVHLFEWRTPHACVKKESPDISCTVKEQGKVVALDRLRRTLGEAWQVFDGRTGTEEAMNLYVNVCGDVSRFQDLSQCPEGAALCRIDGTGNYTSLGRFESEPVYYSASGTVLLTYTNGSRCSENKQWSSQIFFKCRPGHLMGTPVLTNVDKEECVYELEWHTAEVCPFGSLSGTDCSVYSPELGLNLNLNPLKSSSYELNFGPYKLYMSVCEAVRGSPCANNSETKGAAVCQVDKNGKAIAVAKPSTNVTYESGGLYLTYPFYDSFNKSGLISQNVVIVFICDPGAGRGSPHIADEMSSITYVFYWYTSVACIQPTSSECIVQDPVSHKVYDLSRLSLEHRNWLTLYDEGSKGRKAYINICRPLNVVEANCDEDAAVCIVDDEGKVLVPNAGRAHHRPQVSSEGHLQLNFTDGSPCTAFGVKTTYTTVIHFLCASHSSQEDNLWFLGKVGACQFTFLWSTRAACPSNKTVVKGECMLTDPDTGFVFDLTSLRNDASPYSVSGDGKQFQLNICGPVKGGCLNAADEVADPGISVCEVDSKGKQTAAIARGDSYTLSYSKETPLTLSYKNKKDSLSGTSTEVLIKFPCAADALVPKVTFVQKERNQYVFEMKTPLTCRSAHFDCSFMDDKGNEYDLTPLSKTSGLDWVVSDSRREHSNLRYHISFCRPLNHATAYKCSGGSVAACQLDIQNPEGKGLNLGSQFSPPEVSEDGTITLHYTEGSYCENGQFKASTMITLFCSQSQGDLVFIGRTPECEYLFSINTPAACPLQVSYGTDCTVVEPDFGYVFDLKPLQKVTASVTHGKYEYFIKVCGSLDNSDRVPDKCRSSAVCQTTPSDTGFAKSLGVPSTGLVYEKGVITLKYDSGSGDCHGQYNRTSVITFTCDEHAEDMGKPSFVAEAEDCTYMFQWSTNYACPPYDIVECSARDSDGNLYDLTALGLANTNYFVKNPMNTNQTFVLNVCRTVVHTSDSRCPYHSGACLLDLGDADPSKRTKNIGRVEQGPYFEHNRLRLKYTSGEPCNLSNSTSAHFTEAVINFSCNDAFVASDPEYVGRDGCTYYFDWVSAFACPLHHPPPVTASDCSVTDPVTGFVYNLSSLRSSDPYKIQTSNHFYHLNICGGVKNSPCGVHSGVCQEEIGGERHWNAGKPSSELKLSDHVLYLNYSGGDPCHQNRFERNTVIEFYCGNSIGQPNFLYETADCTYHFTWVTELACQSLVHCAIRNGSEHYSLARLSNAGPFSVGSTIPNDERDAVYFIKVCGPLGILNEVPCPPASSICRVTKNGTYAESLGHIEHPPFIDFHGYATSIYTNGSVCQTDSSERYRSRIIFLCDPSELLGEPVLVSKLEEDCFFLFEWKTSIVCPTKPIEVSNMSSCEVRDESRGLHFDLSPARISGSYYEVKDEDSGGSYLLNVCDSVGSSNLDKCANAGVCYQNGSLVQNYGLASNKFSYSLSRVQLTFEGGDDCSDGTDGKRSSEILFMCRPGVGIGRPKLYEKFSCLVVFVWETSLVCLNMQHQCSFDFGSKIYDLHLLSSLTHNWNTTDGEGNVYFLNPCRGVQSDLDTLGCLPSASVCMKGIDGSHMPLGMVDFVEAKHMNSSALLLVYESYSNLACASLKNASNLTATTRIFMTCSQTLGTPKFLSGPDSKCYFDFAWETSVVCPDDEGTVLQEENGILHHGEHEMDIRPILNKTFTVIGRSGSEVYTYVINLGGVRLYAPSTNKCANSAVCQTKPGFKRDIGSVGTRQFYVRRSELYLTLTSLERPCGKNKKRNVTTLFRMQCSSAAGVGQIEFWYESGGCDYIFNWDTYVFCPKFHRPDNKKTSTDSFVDTHTSDSSSSSHRTSIVVTFVFLAIVGCYVIFVLSKPERRAAIASKLRICYSRVTFPRFRYKRGDVLTELQSDF